VLEIINGLAVQQMFLMAMLQLVESWMIIVTVKQMMLPVMTVQVSVMVLLK
jgi:hypothetical protein